VIELEALLASVPDHAVFVGLEETGRQVRRLCEEFPGLARSETVGRSAEGRPISLLTVGHGGRNVLFVGVPHPNEPVGILTALFLARALCEDAALRKTLDITLWVIPIADPDGLALNEGWLGGPLTPLEYALHFYRPPHHEQVEWSYPVRYRTLEFTVPAPETVTVMRVMERVRPEIFYPLHNSGFGGVYFYASHARQDLFERWRKLAGSCGLPLHQGEPEVPYAEEFAPAVYRMFGIADTYDYYANTIDEDPATVLTSGTSGDDWLRQVCDGFSLVCEVPYFTAPALGDPSGSGRTRREAALDGIARAGHVHALCASALGRLGATAPDDRLVRSVRSYVETTPSRLHADRVNAERAEYDREASRSEACDATLGTVFYHMLYLGEASRLAQSAGDETLAGELRGALESLSGSLDREGAIVPLPPRSLVAMQVGAGVLAMLDGRA